MIEETVLAATHLPILRSELLGAVPGVTHGLTRRMPGMGRADGNVGYGAPRDKEDAWRMRRHWCGAIGVNPAHLVTVAQVHGNSVVQVGAADAERGALPGSRPVAAGDALMTDEPGVVLMTLHADCLPILLVDPDRSAVATVHAGWRGTVADIAGEVVRAMRAAYGTRPERLLAYLGPGAGGCCYVVGDDVLRAWAKQAGADADIALGTIDGAPTFDGMAANVWLLRRAGLASERIEVSGICTRCHADAWFSHRAQGTTTGRFAAIITLGGRGSNGHVAG